MGYREGYWGGPRHGWRRFEVNGIGFVKKEGARLQQPVLRQLYLDEHYHCNVIMDAPATSFPCVLVDQFGNPMPGSARASSSEGRTEETSRYLGNDSPAPVTFSGVPMVCSTKAHFSAYGRALGHVEPCSIAREHNKRKLNSQGRLVGMERNIVPGITDPPKKTGRGYLNKYMGRKSFDPSSFGVLPSGEDHAYFCTHPRQTIVRPAINEIENLREDDEFCVIEGMTEPKDVRGLFEVTQQNFMGPNGAITNCGMKLEELVSNTVNALRAGDKHHLTFLSREIYMLKSLKVPVRQREVEVHNLTMKQLKDALLYYIVYYVEESNTELLLFAIYNIAQFFSLYPSRDKEGVEKGTGDVDVITKTLFALNACSSRDVSLEFDKYSPVHPALSVATVVKETASSRQGVNRSHSTTVDINEAINKGDVKTIRSIVSLICNALSHSPAPRPVQVTEEAFTLPELSGHNPDVFFNNAARMAYDNAEFIWSYLFECAKKFDRTSQFKKTVSADIRNTMEVCVEVLRLYHHSTFYTSNNASKTAILSFACSFVALAINDKSVSSDSRAIRDLIEEEAAGNVAAEPGPCNVITGDGRPRSNKTLLGRMNMGVKDSTFDYLGDHLFLPTTERYESSEPYSFDKVYVPKSAVATYLPHEEYPDLVDKMCGRDPKQINEYHKDSSTSSRPCSPITAVFRYCMSAGAVNYSDSVDSPLALDRADFNNEDALSTYRRRGKERYVFSEEEDTVKRHTIYDVRGKFGMDGLFIHHVKKNLGVAVPKGKCRINLFDSSKIPPVRGKSSCALNSVPHQGGDNSNPFVITLEKGTSGAADYLKDSSAGSNYELFIRLLKKNPTQKMRFLSLIVLRAILGVENSLFDKDIYLNSSLGGNYSMEDCYITIENERGVGKRKCEDVIEDCSGYIDKCLPVTSREIGLLPPWCANLFRTKDVCLDKKETMNKYSRAAPGGSPNRRDIYKTRGVPMDVKRAFKASDVSDNLYKMSKREISSAEALDVEVLTRKMNLCNLKQNRKAEYDRYVTHANAASRAAYSAAIQSEDLYAGSTLEREMSNPFVPEGEVVFKKKINKSKKVTTVEGNALALNHPYDMYIDELSREKEYNATCKNYDKTSLNSSDDECTDHDYIIYTRRTVLNDIKASIAQASASAQFVVFDRLSSRIYRNLHRINEVASFLKNPIDA